MSSNMPPERNNDGVNLAAAIAVPIVLLITISVAIVLALTILCVIINKQRKNTGKWLYAPNTDFILKLKIKCCKPMGN